MTFVPPAALSMCVFCHILQLRSCTGFKERVKAVAFTDSVHGTFHLEKEEASWLRKVCTVSAMRSFKYYNGGIGMEHPANRKS